MWDILDEIKTDLSTAIGSTTIKTYYTGEILLIPQSYLPALMVFGTETNIIPKSTAKDQTTHRITIRVVHSLVTKLDEAGTGTTLQAHEDLVKIMEERNSSMVPLSTTVLGTLRRNISGTDYLFNNEIQIVYKTLQAGEFWYVSADCNLTATTNLVLRS